MKKLGGFTLIELLLVLVLVGVGTGLAIVSVDRLAGRVEERRWLDRTLQELKRLRNKAVLSGAPVQATVNFANATISTHAGITLRLPKNYRLSPVTDIRSPGVSAPPTQISLLFFPDGTMQEATFMIATPGALRQQFHLAAVSGRIERLDIAATQ